MSSILYYFNNFWFSDRNSFSKSVLCDLLGQIPYECYFLASKGFVTTSDILLWPHIKLEDCNHNFLKMAKQNLLNIETIPTGAQKEISPWDLRYISSKNWQIILHWRKCMKDTPHIYLNYLLQDISVNK